MTADRTLATASSSSPQTIVCVCCVGRTRGTWMATFRWRHPCLISCTSFVLRSARRAFRASTPCCRARPRLSTPRCWRPSPALGFNADPTTVVTDFEMAAMHAVTAVFGQQMHVQGCFFHLCQSTWRHVQDLGLTALYNADDVAKHFVRMLDGLALLPLADVLAGMAHLRANTPSTSTMSLTISTQLMSLDDTASFSLQPPTPPRPTTGPDPTTAAHVRPRRVERPRRHRHWGGQDEQHVRDLELGIPATRWAPAPEGVDAAEMSPEGCGSRLYTDRTGVVGCRSASVKSACTSICRRA